MNTLYTGRMTKDNTDDRLGEALHRIKTQPAVDVEDVTTAMGVSRATGYAAIKAGEWPSIKARTRRRVPTAWVRQQLMLDD